MRIGIIGSGRIGGNLGVQLVLAGHTVLFSGARDPNKLLALVAQLPGADAASPQEAVASSEAIVFSVPWTQIDNVLEQAGSLADRIVIDTTNQFGAEGIERLGGVSALETNARRMPGAHVAKAFNTYTAGFQRDVATGEVS